MSQQLCVRGLVLRIGLVSLECIDQHNDFEFIVCNSEDCLFLGIEAHSTVDRAS